MDTITVFTRPAGTRVRCYNCGAAHQITVEVMFHYHNKRMARSTVPIALPCGHFNSALVYRSDNPEQTWPAPYDPTLVLEPGFEAYQADFFAAYTPDGEYLGEVSALHLDDARRLFDVRWSRLRPDLESLDLLRRGELTIMLRQY